MSILLVTYDLDKPGQDYNGFHAVIKKHAYTELSESSYAIQTNETPEQVYNQLSPHMDKNDHVYIITLSAPYYGYGPQATNDWLSKAFAFQQV